MDGKVKAEKDMNPLSTPLLSLTGKWTDQPDPGSPGAPVLEGRQSGLLSVLKVLGPRGAQERMTSSDTMEGTETSEKVFSAERQGRTFQKVHDES